MNEKTLLLNDVPYEFNVILANGDRRMVLPKSLFRELRLDESFMNWGFSGYLTYDNSFEQIERFKVSKKKKNSEFFYFRMDGTDEIIIQLIPILEADTAKSKKAKADFPTEIIALNIRGSIYDTEDITKKNIDAKAKKIYFRDYYFNKALT